ncbi:MAG: saccharopine dehydrogenase family protein [Candidatus Hodarchaeales archaeon]|jgi:saccharopine dehydrogenase (NAD+, L-lysine-forming)
MTNKKSRILVLGGSGVVGSMAVRTLNSFSDFTEIVIGDMNKKTAIELIKEINSNKLSFRKVNANYSEEIKETMKEFDIVLNCIGPFYKYGPLVLKAAIDTGRNYVDINDDVDATQDVLKMDLEAKNAGITALIGMGSSPGVTNLLAKFASEQLLDEINSIDLYHAHGGEPFEGPGVIYHRIHSMSIDIPVYMDGAFKSVKFFDEDGKALEEEVDFHKIGKYRVHPYPHPETVTLPKYIKGVQRVTNKGTVLPSEYFYLITDLVKLGITDTKPIDIKGSKISPLDFTIAYIINQRELILEKTNFGIQRGCVKVVVKGKKDNHPHSYVFSLTSEGLAMGEGTGLPAAFGAVLMVRGLIEGKGVLPPEACVNPLDFLGIMREHLDLEETTGGSSPLLIESIDHHGKVEKIDL